MTELVFRAAIRAGGEIANLSLTFKTHKGWTGIATLGTSGYPRHYDLADKATREINALLHAGLPLEALAVAARLSSSNHAEILRAAWAAVQAAETATRSFGLREFC